MLTSRTRPRFRNAAALGALAVVAACATPPPQTGAPGGHACEASPAQFAVGRAYLEDLGASMLKATGAKTLRVIRPGDAVTMDFRDDRLNVELAAGDVVQKVRCG